MFYEVIQEMLGMGHTIPEEENLTKENKSGIGHIKLPLLVFSQTRSKCLPYLSTFHHSYSISMKQLIILLL